MAFLIILHRLKKVHHPLISDTPFHSHTVGLFRQMIEFQHCDRKKFADVVRTVFVPGVILSETDCDGRITYVNEKSAEVYQCGGDELCGTLDDILACRHASDDMATSINRLITSGKIFTGVLKERTKSGNHFWVDVTIVPVKDESGRIFKYVLAKYPIMDNLMGEYLYKKQAKRFGLIQGESLGQIDCCE